MDQTAIEKTSAADHEVTPIRKGESFTFFSNQAKATPVEITETRQVEGIGPLTGVATEQEINGKWLIEFQMEIPPPKTKETTSQPVEGNPGENLVMFATLKSLSPDFTNVQHWACIGQVKEEGGRSIVFDKWFEVDSLTSKTQVITIAQKRQGQPLEAPDGSYVWYSKFKFV